MLTKTFLGLTVLVVASPLAAQAQLPPSESPDKLQTLPQLEAWSARLERFQKKYGGELGVDDRAFKEEQISRWKPTRQNARTPPANVRCQADGLVGLWRRPRRGEADHATLRITRTKPGVYTIRFEAGGCMSSWSLERTATYRNGVLMLNRAVTEDDRSCYQRLFTVRTSQGVRLIADAALFGIEPQPRNRPLSSGQRVDLSPWSFGNESRSVKTVTTPPVARPAPATVPLPMHRSELRLQ